MEVVMAQAAGGALAVAVVAAAPSVAASSSSGAPPTSTMDPARRKTITDEVRKTAFGKSRVKGNCCKVWRVIKDLCKHQEQCDGDEARRLKFSDAGVVRFAKGKKRPWWVATEPHSILPCNYQPVKMTSNGRSSSSFLPTTRRARLSSRT